MSMRDYAINDYGLLFNSNILHVVATKLYDDCSDENWDKNEYDFIERVTETLGLEYLPEFSGEAFKIEDNGQDYWRDADYYCGDSIYYFRAINSPTLFNTAYKNMDELIDEFKHWLGKYLPESFNYRCFIRHIVGTYYG